MQVQGLEEWKKLEGKTVKFDFNFGWGDVWRVGLKIEQVRASRNEFGTPHGAGAL